MASGPITSWQIDEKTMETMTDFISWAQKSQQGFPVGSDGKESACNEGDLVLSLS